MNKFGVSVFEFVAIANFDFNSTAFPSILRSQITTMRGTQVGRISKQWSGLAREFFTDSDYFGLTFPVDLDVYTKATLLGACMLIVNIQNETIFSSSEECHGLNTKWIIFSSQDGIFYSKR